MCGSEWVKHQWSKNGRKYTVKELADHLRFIIEKEKTCKIPSEPPFNIPQRMNLPVLGTQTSNVESLDGKYVADVDELKKRAEKTRRA